MREDLLSIEKDKTAMGVEQVNLVTLDTQLPKNIDTQFHAVLWRGCLSYATIFNQMSGGGIWKPIALIVRGAPNAKWCEDNKVFYYLNTYCGI